MSLSDNGIDLSHINDYIVYFRNKELAWYNGFMDVDYTFHVTDLFDNFFNNEDNIMEFELDTYDKMDFQYNPKGLSYYLYGTPDLWTLILKCNGLDHPGELDLANDKIKVPRIEPLTEYLGRVYTIKDNYFRKLGHKW